MTDVKCEDLTAEVMLDIAKRMASLLDAPNDPVRLYLAAQNLHDLAQKFYSLGHEEGYQCATEFIACGETE